MSSHPGFNPLLINLLSKGKSFDNVILATLYVRWMISFYAIDEVTRYFSEVDAANRVPWMPISTGPYPTQQKLTCEFKRRIGKRIC